MYNNLCKLFSPKLRTRRYRLYAWERVSSPALNACIMATLVLVHEGGADALVCCCRDRVMQVTRTMTRVGCCLVQWHHKLESAT